MKKSSSTSRVVSQFKGIPIETISQIQSAYANRDINTIRTLMNKPSGSDSYILALGRLSNQYVKTISKPEKNEIRQIKSKYKVDLTTNANRNMQIMQNSNRFSGATPKPTVGSNIITGIVHPKKNRNVMITINYPSLSDLVNYFIKMDNIGYQNNIKGYRLYLTLKANDGSTIIVSTKNLLLGESNYIIEFLRKFKNIIEQSTEYPHLVDGFVDTQKIYDEITIAQIELLN